MFITKGQSDQDHQQIASAIKEIVHGNKAKWQLLNEVLNRKLSYIRYQRITKFNGWIDGDDILQEVKLKIHKAIPRIRKILDPAAQDEAIEAISLSINRIARNAKLDQIRRVRSEEKRRADMQDVLVAKMNLDETIFAHEILSALSEEERYMLYLYCIMDLTVREIAEVINTSKSNAHRLFKNALKKAVKVAMANREILVTKKIAKGAGDALAS